MLPQTTWLLVFTEQIKFSFLISINTILQNLNFEIQILLKLILNIINLVLQSMQTHSCLSRSIIVNLLGYLRNYYNIVQQYYMFHSRFNFKEFYYNYFTITKIKVKIVKPLNYKFRYHYNRDTLNRKR